MIVGIGPIRCNISDAGFIGSAFPDRDEGNLKRLEKRGISSPSRRIYWARILLNAGRGTLLSRIPERNQECPRYVKFGEENFPWQIAP
jgi:hypothetical protein